jgi:hypothetical protein
MQQLRRRVLKLASIVFVLGLQIDARSETKKKSVGIEIGSFEDRNETTAWLAYALALSAWANKSGAAEKSPDGILVPTFDGELEARLTQLQIWKELNEKEPMRLAYMDKLLEVQAAGFIREYVWKFHRRPSWGSEPEGLRTAEFEEWQSKALSGHQPHTGAQLRVSSSE